MILCFLTENELKFDQTGRFLKVTAGLGLKKVAVCGCILAILWKTEKVKMNFSIVFSKL